MPKRNSVKRQAVTPDPSRDKVKATIGDLYHETIGVPPVRIWFIEFTYERPRSPTVYHDWESIQSDIMPTPEQWTDRILIRFDCIERSSLVKGIAGWVNNHVNTSSLG